MAQASSTPTTLLEATATAAGVAVCLALGWLALGQRPPAAVARSVAGNETLAQAPRLAPCATDPEGYWRGRLIAGRSLDLDWRGSALECAGNARPGDRGLRLFFAGHTGEGGERLLFIVGIAATDPAKLAGREHPASVTLVDEAGSRFFASREGSCFTRVSTVEPLAGANWRVEGELYCANALGAVAGEGSVTLGDSAYAGRLTLGDSP